MVKKIAVLTTTRADYGILQPLIHALHEADWAELQLIVTGSHLLESQGRTVREVEADGLPIAARVPIFEEGTTTALDNARAFGVAAERMAPVLVDLKSDTLVLLGDRFETLAIAAATALLHIPIVHLHGGEESAGALDNRFRHAISQLADWHLTATEKAAEKLRQMGLPAERIHHVGALGVWNVLNQPRLDREALQRQIPVPLRSPLFVITFHPETATDQSPEQQVRALIDALAQFPEASQIITYANVDEGGETINRLWREYAKAHPGTVWLTPSLGRLRYHSLLAIADVVIGNSSSGILEAPSFGLTTVNIGDRQAGRERAESVIDTPAENEAIIEAIRTALSRGRRTVKNPYEKADTLSEMLQILKGVV
ncbi:UDP-N-acetylglucosamine 2-epimerase [Sulfurivirga sp.]|uniref:UDP-N-acetylglucosamine 2-epimerase n=1 Tax=Sulfurivirga sp. TaxID=2614236 RepID=UPI0025F19E52|nr:UDP-N-acetylglucosamine 2-epimerase [Sulfurivirga sp.]